MSKKNNILQSAVTAKYFGFNISKKITVKKEDIQTTKNAQKDVGYLDENLFPMEEAIAILKSYKEDLDNGKIEPLLFYSEGSFSGNHKKKRKKNNEEILNFHIINDPKSIADALLIKMAQVILAESGIKNICVRINNVGGKEAQNAFLREATNYYRKNINNMNANCRQFFKEGVHNLMSKGRKKCSEIHENAPKTMDFLGDETRKNFSQILEFLETMSIPYEINSFVLGDQNYSSHTVFEIVDLETNKIIGAGTRYNLLYKKIGTRKEIPAVGMILNVPEQKKFTERIITKIEKTQNFFAQIGYEAKLNSLNIIDDLRKNNIAIKHKIYRDRLSTQIAAAKKADSEILVIIGQKEAMENTAIIRDKDNKSQKIIHTKDLIKTLKSNT